MDNTADKPRFGEIWKPREEGNSCLIITTAKMEYGLMEEEGYVVVYAPIGCSEIMASEIEDFYDCFERVVSDSGVFLT